MIRALAICTVLAATATTASAGVYGSLGIGSTDVDDSANTLTPASRSGRIAGGYQYGPYVSAEAGLMGFDAAKDNLKFDGREYYVAGLFHWSLGQGFEAFGRLGLQHTSLSEEQNPLTLSGNGYLFGAGFAYNIKFSGMPVPRASVWVDYTRNNSSLFRSDVDNSAERDTSVSMWTLGVTVGM